MAYELTHGKDFDAVEALAAAHAEKGNFDEAVRFTTAALSLAETDKETARAERMLDSFQARKPYRSEPSPPAKESGVAR